jgi:hypothetical protein
MDEQLKSFEKSIRKVHRFGVTPKYEESFTSSLPAEAFLSIAIKTVEKLGWELVYHDSVNVVAKRLYTAMGSSNGTEKITITYLPGNPVVKSESLGNEMWDVGRNSKRVKLFIHAFEQTAKSYDREAISAMTEEVKQEQEMSNYIIPDTLPQPLHHRKANPLLPVATGIILGLILGYIVAQITINGLYFIIIIEALVALAIGYCFSQVIKLSNYTDFGNLKLLLMITIVIVYFSSLYFQYIILIGDTHFGFLNFIDLRIKFGLTIKSLNLGSAGLIISWGIQLVVTYLIAIQRIAIAVTEYTMKKVPPAVIEFAVYHFVKGKQENEVRRELSSKGWTNASDQDDVFKAIGTASVLNNMRK